MMRVDRNAPEGSKRPLQGPPPRVTVVLPCYGQAEFLTEAVESLIAQSYTDWQCVIVDDGSPDDTAAVATQLKSRFPEHRLELLRQQNAGVASARNTAMRASQSPYLLPLDADDRLAPDFLEKCVALLDSDESLDVVYSDVQHFGAQNDVYRSGPFTLESQLQDNRIPYCALYRRSVFEAVNGYDQQLGGYNDWDFWLGALKQGRSGKRVAEPLFWYRKRTAATMLTEANRHRNLLVARLTMKHQELFPLASVLRAKKHLGFEESKRILLCVSHFWPSRGGVETAAEQLARDLVASGFIVDVLTAEMPGRRGWSSAVITILEHSGPAGDFSRWGAYADDIREAIESGLYEACILLADPLNWVFGALEGLCVPANTTVIAQPLINEDGFAQWAVNPVRVESISARLRAATVVTTLTTDGVDACFCRAVGIAPVRIPNAVPRRAGRGVDVRVRLGIPEDVPLFVQVANFWPVKNQLGLMEALDGMPGEWHLVLVGSPAGDTEFSRRVLTAARARDRVTVLEGLDAEDVADVMRAATLLLVPSHGEVAPIVVLEAMSHGLPWVATPSCGSVWEHSGGVVADLTAFPRVIELLSSNPILARRLGELGREHWKSSYTPECALAAWLSLLEGDAAGEMAADDGIALRETALLATQVREAAGVAFATKRRGLVDLGWTQSSAEVFMDLGRHGPSASPAPLVSVIVVTKDRPRLLMDALASIIDQTYQRWEAVVVNDAGDEIGELATGCDPEGRIRYYRHTESLGLSAARNTGIGLSRGKILCYLDDDDRLLPDHLATVVRELQRTGSEIVYTEAERVIEALENDRRIEHRRDRPYSGISYSRERLHVSNFIPVNTFAHRRKLLERTGLFDTGLSALEDWDLLLRMARETTFVRVPRVTVEVRQRAASADDHLTARKRKEYPALFRQIYGRYPVDSAPELEEARRLQLRALDDEVSASGVVGTYCQWVGKHALKESDAQYMAERMMLEWRSHPTFHLLLAHEAGMEAALADIVDSLASQLYHGWGLSVVSREPAPPGFDAIPKLEWIRVDGDRLEAVNSVVQQSTADWILLLEPGARLAPEALFAIADYAQKFRAWQLVYSDEDRIGPDGERHSPLFKPDFNLDLLRSASYMGPLVWFRRELLVGIGGFREFGTATVYDAVFRALETAGESAVGHVAKVLSHRSDRHHATGDVSDEHQCGLRVVEQHLERLGTRATVCAGLAAGTHEVEYALERMPKVSVIVPTRDQATLLRACVDGVVGLTNYPDFEVLIVDNGSTEPEALAYLEDILVRDPRVRVLRYDEPYSFSAINNFAASQASGELLLLLNNDTEVLHEDWMTQMVRHALRPEIGAVGVRLVYPDGRIQHAGVVLGMTSTADHPEAGTPMEEAGYMGRLQVAQNWSAVTAACLMVRKELYQAVGGLDEKDFNVLFNDVDFCLKLVTAGYRSVWTPHATLVHHASVSLKANADAAALERAQREREALQEKWGRSLAADPAFNRNLSLSSQRIVVETAVDVPWDPVFCERPRIMAFPLDAQGTGHYRVWGPLAALDRAALAQYSLLPIHGAGSRGARLPSVPELQRANPNTLLIQHGYLDLFLAWLDHYRRHASTFLVFGQDDNILNVPDRNAMKKSLIAGLESRVARAMSSCDRLIVTTEPLVDVYRKYISDIHVIPNALDGSRWTGLVSRRRAGRRPRVGWAGALQHLGDLEWLEPVLRELSREVDWVFMGMCPEGLRPYVREFHPAVAFEGYPAKLASLDLDLALAPLELHPFNEAKSDLRILEYGVLGWPVIATDIYPYQGRPVTCIPNDPARWIAAIRERVNDLDALAVEGDRLREWVLAHRMLENNLDAWVRALFSDEVLREFGVIRSLAA